MEVYDELKKALKEIEIQKEIIRQLAIKNLDLTSIIKEVREYIERETKELYSRNKSCKYLGEIMQLENVIEILDKVENK